MNQKIQEFSTEQPTHDRERKRLRRRKQKKTIVKKIGRWIRENPLKLVAIFCLAVLIYITVLFVLRSREERSLKGLPETRKAATVKVGTRYLLQVNELLIF